MGPDFRRDRDGDQTGANALLNHGYAIPRDGGAIDRRGRTASGDLVEPFRHWSMHLSYR